MSKVYKIVVTTPLEHVSYDVFAPDLGVRICDEVLSCTGKNENDAIIQLRQLCATGHSVLIITNGTIISVDSIPRKKIPSNFLLNNVNIWSGDMLVVKSKLNRDNFELQIL